MVIAFASFVQKYSPLDPVPIDFGPIEFKLQNLEKIFVGEGPEDVVFDKQGRAYTGCADGWVEIPCGEFRFPCGMISHYINIHKRIYEFIFCVSYLVLIIL
ncbi:hypothetical protein R1flu_011775 [Riccia fluitans]|uniref:Uncharacterized protein n=1 Tax=Riccia fluitans TaxID=41844 RepID=A0ABD1Z8R2_9MARC